MQAKQVSEAKQSDDDKISQLTDLSRRCWFFVDGVSKECVGPCNEVFLTDKFRSGELTWDSLVWNGCFDKKWSRLSRLPDLLGRLKRKSEGFRKLEAFDKKLSCAVKCGMDKVSAIAAVKTIESKARKESVVSDDSLSGYSDMTEEKQAVLAARPVLGDLHTGRSDASLQRKRHSLVRYRCAQSMVVRAARPVIPEMRRMESKVSHYFHVDSESSLSRLSSLTSVTCVSPKPLDISSVERTDVGRPVLEPLSTEEAVFVDGDCGVCAVKKVGYFEYEASMILSEGLKSVSTPSLPVSPEVASDECAEECALDLADDKNDDESEMKSPSSPLPVCFALSLSLTATQVTSPRKLKEKSDDSGTGLALSDSSKTTMEIPAPSVIMREVNMFLFGSLNSQDMASTSSTVTLSSWH